MIDIAKRNERIAEYGLLTSRRADITPYQEALCREKDLVNYENGRNEAFKQVGNNLAKQFDSALLNRVLIAYGAIND